MNDVTGTQNEWVIGPTPTFVGASQFTLVGDQTIAFTKARRLKFTVTAGTVYGSITGSAFGALTTVNVAFDSGALDSGLSAVSYSVTSPTNSSIGEDYSAKFATTVPSSGSGTTNIWGIAGDYTHVTGTNAIFNFSSAPYPGVSRTVIFDSVLSLNHNAPALNVPGAANVTTAANDRAIVRADSVSTATVISLFKASGRPISIVGADAGWSLLATGTAASSATLDFTNLTGFAAYFFEFSNLVPQTNAVHLYMRISQDNGGSFKAGASDYSYASNGFDTAGNPINMGATSDAVNFVQSISSTAAKGVCGFVLTSDLAATVTKGFVGHFVGFRSTGKQTNQPGIGSYDTDNTAINAIRFLMSSGNMNTGTIKCYGLRSA